MPSIQLADRLIGPGQPCFVIAEAGVNHNGSLERAKALVDIACNAGADAVKFQTFRTEEVISSSAPKADYQKRATCGEESQFEMVKKLELPFEAFSELMRHCVHRGIRFLSTPFDTASVDFLMNSGVEMFKVPSGEITNLAFLRYVARTMKPVILSSGMSTLNEVELAVRAIRDEGAGSPVVLHCVSNYPAQAADANLRCLSTIASDLNVVTGYSDHHEGNEVAYAAVALGACVIEKHFTIDKTLAGPDHAASLEPDELSALINGIRVVERALGDGRKMPRPSEMNTRVVARRSLFTRRPISTGNRFSAEDLVALRPGDGLSPSSMDSIIGCVARSDLPKGHKLCDADFE